MGFGFRVLGLGFKPQAAIPASRVQAAVWQPSGEEPRFCLVYGGFKGLGFRGLWV